MSDLHMLLFVKLSTADISRSIIYISIAIHVSMCKFASLSVSVSVVCLDASPLHNQEGSYLNCGVLTTSVTRSSVGAANHTPISHTIKIDG